MVPQNSKHERRTTDSSLSMEHVNSFELDLYHRRRNLGLEWRKVEMMLERESRRHLVDERHLERDMTDGSLFFSSHSVGSPRSLSHFDSRVSSARGYLDSGERPTSAFHRKEEEPSQLLKRLQLEIELNTIRLNELRCVPSSGRSRHHPATVNVGSPRKVASAAPSRSVEISGSYAKHPRYYQRRGTIGHRASHRPDRVYLSSPLDNKKTRSFPLQVQGERKKHQLEMPQQDGKQFAFPMSHRRDPHVLTKYQTLIRQSLEFFQAIPSDLLSNVRGRSKRVKVGQVGVRCIYCNHKPMHRRERCSLAFPSHLWGVYQAAQSVAKNHLIGSCTEVPESVRQELIRMRGAASAKTGGGKMHWEDSCREVGLYQDEDEPGIWLRRSFS